jgi:2-succinyl-5-enolpyruvyl-6-hydroxy-3-cyclohexene-1-carboxylate synthase
VAFVHDSSSLAGLRDRGLDVRILVTHNDGGGIFGYLPQASLVDGGRFERLFGTPHGTDVEGLARAHGLRAHTFAKLDGLGDFLSVAGPSVAVVRTDRAGDQVWHRRLHDAVAAATA